MKTNRETTNQPTNKRLLIGNNGNNCTVYQGISMNGYGYEHKSWGTYYSTIFYFMALEVSVAECSYTMSKVVVISARWETNDLKSLKL